MRFPDLVNPSGDISILIGRLHLVGRQRTRMVQSEIDAIRTMLSSKPRPVGWAERRGRIDEVGSVWPVAEDIALTPVNAGGVPAEWSIAPGSDASRVLMFLHGGGYCSGSILSHRRMVTEAGRAAGMRTLAIGYRLAPEHPFPAALEDALAAWRFVLTQAIGPRMSPSAATAPVAGFRLRSSTRCAAPVNRFPPVRGWYRRGRTWRCPARRSPARTRSIRLFTRTISTNWPTPISHVGRTARIRGFRRSTPTCTAFRRR